MAKKFDEMTLEERKEAFNKWLTTRKRANEDPIDLVIDEVEEALWHFIPEANHEAAHEELVDAIADLFLAVDEATTEVV